MNNNEIFKYVDHTRLAATATAEEIRTLCNEAVKYGTASVCIPPCYIETVKKEFPDLNICTVIGFPLGYCTTETKIFETKDAVEKGADEIDMVINVCHVKNGDFTAVLEEIKAVKAACGGKLLKVIIEACYLTDEEKIKLCKIVTEAGAEYIKTSTGFGSGGATTEDIVLFRENIGPDVKMKAAGGIRTKEDMEKFIALGCSRIGTSGAVKALKE
ncbi:MAG: deoxyribose-phosphate aldolase [Ruminiclostridium sp.]|nr:deoxyribose-phosphate aldolase [Ruminiclostridium sp.]